ncbi:MAG: hypothetical protein ABR549_11580 [Mycobacteriales bacterium]
MTRPSPQEVVDGIRRTLDDVIAPELTSEHARQRLAEVRAVLAQLDWNDAGLQLAQRTARLRALLARAGGDADLVDQSPADTWAGLAAQHDAYAAALLERVHDGPLHTELVDLLLR